MALIVATNAQGKQVIADSAEAKALGYTPVTNSQNNNGAPTSGSGAPENVHNSLGVTSDELVAIAKSGGGTLQTIGGTYDVKPTKEAVQKQETASVSKSVGEPVKYGGGQSNVKYGEGTVYYGTSGTQYFYSPDQGKIYWSQGQANTTQTSKATLPASNNTYYNPFRNETFTITTSVNADQQYELARMEYLASHISPVENLPLFMSYVVWSMPNNIGPLLQGAIVKMGGGTEEQVRQAVFEAGPLAFVQQSHYSPIEFIETMALKSLWISLPATQPLSQAVTSLTLMGSTEYSMTRSMSENRLDFTTAAVDLTVIGLSALGVQASMNDFLGKAQVDPIISKIDVKGFHESAEDIPQTKYVPILGREFTYVQNQETLDVKLLGEKPIYGRPQDVPIDLKDFDNLIQLNIREDSNGVIKTSQLVFKSTEQGVEPTGGATITEFIPYERQPIMHILDVLGPDNLQDWQLNSGQLKEIDFEATKPNLNIMEGEARPGVARVINMKVIGIEKPEEYVPDMMLSPNKAGPWITTGDATGIVSKISKVDEYTIPIDLTHGPMSMEFESGKGTTLKWLTDEDYLKETAAPIGQEVIETTPRHVIVNTNNEGPVKVFIPQVGWVESNERENRQNQYTSDVARTKGPDINIMINTGMNEKETPMDFTSVGENNLIRIINNQGSASFFGQGQNQSQSQRQSQLEMQTNSLIFREVSVNVSQPSQDNRGREPNPDEGGTSFPWRSNGGSPMKFIIINSAGMSKMFKISSFNLPTASDMSLEKAFSKYGHASLARGPGVEKAYREQAETYGLGSVGFPAAELIKRIRGGYKR